jgi:hypothetical protein
VDGAPFQREVVPTSLEDGVAFHLLEIIHRGAPLLRRWLCLGSAPEAKPTLLCPCCLPVAALQASGNTTLARMLPTIS